MNKIMSNVTLIPNQLIDDNRVTWKAKGIFMQLASMDTDSHISINMLTKLSPDGKTAVRTGVEELIKYGYLDRYQVKDCFGDNGGWRYVVKLPA